MAPVWDAPLEVGERLDLPARGDSGLPKGKGMDRGREPSQDRWKRKSCPVSFLCYAGSS